MEYIHHQFKDYCTTFTSQDPPPSDMVRGSTKSSFWVIHGDSPCLLRVMQRSCDINVNNIVDFRNDLQSKSWSSGLFIFIFFFLFWVWVFHTGPLHLFFLSFFVFFNPSTKSKFNTYYNSLSSFINVELS